MWGPRAGLLGGREADNTAASTASWLRWAVSGGNTGDSCAVGADAEKGCGGEGAQEDQGWWNEQVSRAR